ncbi:unnamed protein product [Toxocara canis]|uniref:Major sperm protein n=1 Tax=Toxocara canis TaxID=6265 RepID=A0A183UUF7_TOXCA|nr:unnamed protein product [Toxocara canis]
MADADLEAIRASRLAQMQGEQIGGGESDAKLKAEQARKAAEQQENMKNSILHQVLDQSAMARLSNLRAAKPEKAAIVENTIIQMARMGQIASKMSDEALKELLDRISEKTHKTTTVKLVFAGDVTGEIRVIMKLTNKSRSRQAFKVKCSRNDLFRIRPSTGILDYGKSVYINITYKCLNHEIPESDRHHFGIYHIPAPEGCSCTGAWTEHYGPPQGELRLKLVFTGDVLGEIRTTIKLTNRSDSRQAFKVKCTRNDLFRIRPAIGILDYKQTVLVTVIYRCQNNQAPESDRHHFGIYHIPAPEGCTGSGAWAEHYGPPQGELRLKVTDLRRGKL